MKNSFVRSFELYFEHVKFILLSSIFALLSLGLIPFVSTYITGGTGFIRYSSIIRDMNLIQLAFIVLLVTASLFLLSLFVSSVIAIIKMRETLDITQFDRIASIFGKYVSRVFVFFLLMTSITLLIGTAFTVLNVPDIIAQTIIFIIWAFFIFTPQVIILENFPLLEAMEDSANFIFDRPFSLIWYLVCGFVALFAVTLFEIFLGSLFVWEHKIITLFLTSIIILPILQIFASVLYVRRYGVARL